MRVTMVDDSAADRKLCRMLLEDKYGWDLQFVEAATAAAGLDACRAANTSDAPSCLLLDYKLPDMNGLQFLERLSGMADPIPRKFAVIMLTGLGYECVSAAAIKAGVQDYLVKDRISAESLQFAVENAVEKVALVQALKADRDQLARSVAEKDVLLHEVHHRVKNNLQVIVSLLRLQAEGFEAAGIADQRLTRAFRDSQNRVESMALIHEQLYATPLSPGSTFREVDLASFASTLARNLTHAYGVDPRRIACRVNVEPLREPVNCAVPVGLILNELLSNALQHAFPDNRRGSLWVEGRIKARAEGPVERDGGRGTVELVVGDDGAGIPETSGAGPKSLGLEIVRILTRQLHGDFEIERGPESSGGTVCRVSFTRADVSGGQVN
jgi:two-component sensor histidine kinase